MRKQYHFRQVGHDVLIWDVTSLVAAADGIPTRRIPVTQIRELDEPYWFEATSTVPTCRRVIEHMKLIEGADLTHPILLSSDGRVMDGMHRVAKAVLRGVADVEAVVFETDPDPDYLNLDPGELPY